MSLEFLNWKSEAHMESWLQEELSVRPRSFGILPDLPEGYIWDHQEDGKDGAQVYVDVLRQVYIPNADTSGRGSAPCDLLLTQQILSANTRTYVATVSVIIELKARKLKSGDFGQLVRYVDALLRRADGAIGTGHAPEIVLGALVGDGWDRQVGQLADRISGFRAFDTTEYGTHIVLDRLGQGLWFPHGNTLAFPAMGVE
jgi:hypothetical protein